uniref:GrpE like 2, mitochondrial n=1 Tax=Prolemur simus TaxID=1328070 RepID=A0A8C9B1H1_PROSS
MAVRSLWAVRRRGQRLLALSTAWESRGWLLPFSTVTQRTAGEDCSSEDPPDELGPSLAERALRIKAVKLEKEVQDLTVRYQRAVADCENIKRRTQRCVEDAKIFGETFIHNKNVFQLVLPPQPP